MDPQQIKAFIDAMAASDLQEMEVSHDGWTLRLTRGARPMPPVPTADAVVLAAAPTAAPLAGTASAANGPSHLGAPMFGVVHLQQAPGEAPFVQVGDAVRPGQLLCTIEAMKVFNEVRAEWAGRVAAVLAPSGTEVEAGQPLFAIERGDDV
jgi:acetyl-CoA carboxylase biotin carboxyl carrier protein